MKFPFAVHRSISRVNDLLNCRRRDLVEGTRKYRDAVLAEGIHKLFTDSPVTDKLVLKDLCYRGQGFLGNHGKETKTSWDTLSYTLLQSHNVWMHMNAVQEANRKYEIGLIPKMLSHQFEGGRFFTELVDEIFSKSTKQTHQGNQNNKSNLLLQPHGKYTQ